MKFPLRDWITGFVLERCSRAFEPKPIVAYLYNGVRLPALPEWDREKYGCGAIFYSDYTGGYSFYPSEFPRVMDLSDGKLKYKLEDGSLSTKYMDSEAYTWTDTYENGWKRTSSLVDPTISPNPSGVLIWADYDVLNTDKSIYLGASEPVPVYE